MAIFNFKAGHAARVVLLLALVFSASAAHAGRFLYSGGHALNNGRVAGIGHTYAGFPANDAGWAGALSGAYGPYDAILVGEASGNTSISPATRASIAAYVSNGGRIIVAGDHNGNVGFLNQTFSYATTLAYGCMSNNSVAGSLQSGAAGTSFAAGPATVANLSCTSALNLSSVPAGARTIYAGTGTSLAFIAQFGSGQLTWVGWDFCCGGSTTQLDDWYLVLDNAIAFSGLFSTCAAEGYAGAKLTLCRQVCEVNPTTSRLAGLVKLYTAIYRAPPPCSAVLSRLN